MFINLIKHNLELHAIFFEIQIDLRYLFFNVLSTLIYLIRCKRYFFLYDHFICIHLYSQELKAILKHAPWLSKK